MANPVMFGNYQFKTKTAAKTEIRKRIKNYEFGQKLVFEDEEFFAELFKLHDEYGEKIGCGMSCISVERDFHGNKCLYIHRIDGSRIDISWVHCVQPASNKTVVSYAFRRAIKDTIITFKLHCISESPHCPKLGTALDFNNSDVVYVQPTFDELLTSFLRSIGKSIEEVGLINPKPEDDDQRGIIKDSCLKTEWLAYHKENAHLELWSREANRRK